MVRLGLIAIALLLAPTMSVAQSQLFETCPSRSACASATAENIRQSQDLLRRQRFRDAALYLFPVLSAKNENLATRSRLDASLALTGVLSDAELYEYAAMEARTFNRLTSAPSSMGLLREARLLDLAGDKDAAAIVYRRAEDLAVASANLNTVDELISDFDSRGDQTKADALRANRREIAEQFDRACSEARCRSATIVPATIQSNVRASYPSDAQRQRLSGSCRVTVHVSETGETRDIKTDCSNSVFNDSAYEAARRTRFSPRFSNGAPEPDYDIILPIEFALQ
ncbi:MAG: energy transducer TonB [Pseudomonadota bacterium]